ncbi:DNA topoisomerase I [Mycoplasma sp. NEAQ87857]|uniref:type IA DNA topoisomerase n=1 Tax=Mycoplasma sp. NEAQ87857 TaxID=2683967 RepID=UPI001318578C|nr:type IA DNA topoisomerase [Mycoplasma sp. NEAQ87857]QGZ97970.1 DNA topoisomerase I [Mycoplasma sp. NEAQ87857]
MNLVIIEGAGKIKKIKQILGDGYSVVATGGHFKELENNGLYNVGINQQYEPSFVYSDNGKKTWKNILDSINNFKYQNIYIASDPDREGEAIAYHIYNSLPKSKLQNAKRIVFHEISAKAINQAINNPIELNMNLVYAQFARLIYDKLFGYRASSFIQQNLGLKSIGRIQGVAVKLLGDRDKEIANYQPNYKFKLTINVLGDNQKEVSLTEIDENENIKYYDSQDQIDTNINQVQCTKITTEAPKALKVPKPYITSTLLVDITKKYNVKAKEVQNALQVLYQDGLITYPRTDNYNISNDFMIELIDYLKIKKYHQVEDILDVKDVRNYKNNENSQEAHECLRIVHPEITTMSLIDKYKQLELGIYETLYNRTILQGLKDAIYQNTKIKLSSNNHCFITTSKKFTFLGFVRYLNKDDDIKSFTLNQSYKSSSEVKQVNLNPEPKLYTEASLINELEHKSIGRPSTYATFGGILLDREYAIKNKKDLVLTHKGKVLYQIVEREFKDFCNYDFTKNFEKDLDSIVLGQNNYQAYLKMQDNLISNLLNNKTNQDYSNLKQEIKESRYTRSKEKFCDACNEYRIERTSKTGNTFWVCSNYKYDASTKISSGCSIEWNNIYKNNKKLKK